MGKKTEQLVFFLLFNMFLKSIDFLLTASWSCSLSCRALKEKNLFLSFFTLQWFTDMGPDSSDLMGSYASQVNNWNKLKVQSGIKAQAGILQVPLLLDISGLRHIVFGPF